MGSRPVTVIVPVWNRAAEAIRCLERLAAVDSPPVGVLVIDNGSEPGQAALLGEFCGRWPDRFEIIVQERNLGFAGGVNCGLERAFAGGAAAALVLNSDALVTPDTIGILCKISRSRPRAGILGPRIVDPTREGREISAGERVSPWTLPLPRTLLRHRGATREIHPVDAVLGCAMFITRECYDTIGSLEESFFAYYEEVDYCLRARSAALEVIVCPRASVMHAPGRGFAAGFEPLSAYLKARNLLLLMWRQGAWYHWPAFAAGYLLLLFASGAAYAVRGRGDVVSALARGMADGLLRRSGSPPADLGAGRVAVEGDVSAHAGGEKMV